MARDPFTPALGDEAPVASITTASGQWRLGWDPARATFWAAHHRGALAGRADHELGAGPGACPTVGALEEALGFALPRPVRAALAAVRAQRPPVAYPRSELLPDPDRPRGVDTYPAWDDVVELSSDGGRWPYGLALERERPLATAELGEGTCLEILAATPEPATGGQRVEYRLTHEGRVMFAGGDIHAPAGADVADDGSLRALLAVVVDPDAPHRSRPLSPGQTAFTAAHAERLRAAVRPPTHPYPQGTRVAAAVDGQRWTGVVTHAATIHGDTYGYSWRPDVAGLVGHPWRDQPELGLVSAPDALTPTLAPPFRGGAVEAVHPLAFGAVVVAAHPDTGARVEATVVRAYAPGDGYLYQVQPRDPGLSPDFMVAADDCAVAQVAWWPSRADLIEARQAAGVERAPGEVFVAAPTTDRLLSVVGAAHPPPLTAAQQQAALVADEPSPRALKVVRDGPLTLVGDPHHGWLPVDTERWLTAMTRPQEELRGLVNAAAGPGTLRGGESVPVLAALAALHSSEDIGPAPAGLVDAVAAPPAEQLGVGW